MNGRSIAHFIQFYLSFKGHEYKGRIDGHQRRAGTAIGLFQVALMSTSITRSFYLIIYGSDDVF
jgi:hypothetical protein